MLIGRLWLLCLVFVLFFMVIHAVRAPRGFQNSLKSATYLSPVFSLKPGSVANKLYLDIPFPRGHIALKGFDAEVVDKKGMPVPLHETYLHHWFIVGYYGRKQMKDPPEASSSDVGSLDYNLVRNSGICKSTLWQFFGLGSETRRTHTSVPDPYGIEVGNPDEIPDEFEMRWLLNVHAIDTRGVVDKLGCTECRCSLYNVTKDDHGRALRKNYIGGLNCCYDGTQCQTREGYGGTSRELYLRYTVKWVEWDESIVPVKIYIFDVTDTAYALNGTADDESILYSCKVEYQVDPCNLIDRGNSECVDVSKAKVVIPRGGDIVYAVAHQHSGGLGSTLYGQDGRILCTSNPTYGDGEEAGNEKEYIVGMSTCYPSPGSTRVFDGEVLTLLSNYSSTQLHTGVMCLFHVFVAEPQKQPKTTMFQNHLFSLGDEAA